MKSILLLGLVWLSTPARGDELLLHLIPAPTRTRWESPRKLAVSAIRNEIVGHEGLKRHGIGHLYVELNCGEAKVLTGATSTGNTEERRALFREGYGLGVLFKNYRGKLDSQAEVAEDLASMQESGRSSFLRFRISHSACNRAILYWIDYQLRGYDRIYAGLNARPLRGESAGCTAFGVSFLEILNLLHPEFSGKWTTKLVVPRRFVGGPLTEERVSVLKLLFAFSAKWDEDSSKGGFPLDFWDPEKMNEWIREGFDSLTSGRTIPLPWSAKAVRLGESPGIEFDTTWVSVPETPVFPPLGL